MPTREADPVNAYQEALTRLQQSRLAATALAEMVVRGGEACHRWRTIVVTNCSPVFPVQDLGGPTLNAANWPSGQLLGQMFGAYHLALIEARSAFRAIPAAQRLRLQEPPE